MARLRQLALNTRDCHTLLDERLLTASRILSLAETARKFETESEKVRLQPPDRRRSHHGSNFLDRDQIL